MKSHKYLCGSRNCDLCICEKLLIARRDPYVLLNKRDELISKCRHEQYKDNVIIGKKTI